MSGALRTAPVRQEARGRGRAGLGILSRYASAAREGKPMPSFEDYYPAQKGHCRKGA